MTPQRRAFIALLVLVPAPTIGTLCAMILPGVAGTLVGHGIYAASKLWILIVPLWWWFAVARAEPRRIRRGGSMRVASIVGVVLGVALSAAIILGYLLLGRHLIDRGEFAAAAEVSGFADPMRFVVLAAYICTINALLEEIVWRWFVFRRVEEFLPAGHGGVAVVLSAILFSIHHAVALAPQFGVVATVLGTIGVFVGGVAWSWCYLRFRSIWPGYLSHVIVDITVFSLGGAMLFWVSA